MYLPGGDLASLMSRRRLGEHAAIQLGVAIGEALALAHAQGVVHRDLKPENILLAEDGTPKLTDFGISAVAAGPEDTQLTPTGRVMGTTAYMAPEQRVGARYADHRADLYALGLILYELATGHTLPEARTHALELGGLSHGFGAVVTRAAAPDPRARFEDALAFKAALTALQPT